jgi:hypothetical protein
MPVTVEVQNDNRIAIVKWENPVIHNDFMTVFQIMEPVYKEAKRPVHSIYLADDLNNLPPRAISTYLRDKRSPLINPMSGLMIVVTEKAFIRAITETAAKMVPAGKLATAKTKHEALARIEEILAAEV